MAGSTRPPYQIYAFHASSGSSRLSDAVSSTTDEETKTVDPFGFWISPTTPRALPFEWRTAASISASDWGLGNKTMIDPVRDLVVVLRWLQGSALDGFLTRLGQAIET